MRGMRARTHPTPLFSPITAPQNPPPPRYLAAACSPESPLHSPIACQRTKLENKTVQVTNKITCCLHLAGAIKAPTTSEDGLLMRRLKARRRKKAPRRSLALCFLLSVGFGICYDEIFIIKTVARTRQTLNWFLDLKVDLEDPIREKKAKQTPQQQQQHKDREGRICVRWSTSQI